ncbi:hypothetical protein ABKN59_011301 [Abortiporus biennis]
MDITKRQASETSIILPYTWMYWWSLKCFCRLFLRAVGSFLPPVLKLTAKNEVVNVKKCWSSSVAPTMFVLGIVAEWNALSRLWELWKSPLLESYHGPLDINYASQFLLVGVPLSKILMLITWMFL